MATKAQKPPADTRAVLKFPKETVKLRRDSTILGREKGDILVNDTEVSSTHCQIQNIEDAYYIFDMNSSNGTFVNGERILRSKLAPGDKITVGQTEVIFEILNESELRHAATRFKSVSKRPAEGTPNLVDTLIENELRSTQPHGLTIKFTYGDGTREEVFLKQRLLYVGRASSFGRLDQDQELSRKHLLIKLNDDGEIFAEDQGSTNGSFLNGKRMTGMHPVGPSDIIRIGSILLQISAGQPQ